jgi:hypothetical protein
LNGRPAGLGGNEQKFILSLLNVEVADARLRLTVKDAAGSAIMINWNHR